MGHCSPSRSGATPVVGTLRLRKLTSPRSADYQHHAHTLTGKANEKRTGERSLISFSVACKSATFTACHWSPGHGGLTPIRVIAASAVRDKAGGQGLVAFSRRICGGMRMGWGGAGGREAGVGLKTGRKVVVVVFGRHGSSAAPPAVASGMDAADGSEGLASNSCRCATQKKGAQERAPR